MPKERDLNFELLRMLSKIRNFRKIRVKLFKILGVTAMIEMVSKRLDGKLFFQ